MSNERKNHQLPSPMNYPSPEQLQNSIDAMQPLNSGDKRIKRYGGMMDRAKDELAEWKISEGRRKKLNRLAKPSESLQR